MQGTQLVLNENVVKRMEGKTKIGFELTKMYKGILGSGSAGMKVGL